MNEFQWDKIKFGDRIVSQAGRNNVVLHNVNAMKTVKITKEVFKIIKEICATESNINDVVNNCETQEDADYLLKILSYLAENNIIRELNDFSEYRDIGIKIDWDITNRCNLKCRHCCVSADIANQELDGKSLLDIVEKLTLLKPTAIIISGGEPLIRKDFKAIISKLREKYKGYLSLMTNALLINEEMAEYINDNFDSVSVSLDGVDEETCSAVRGKGVFDKTITGIKKLQDAGMDKISVSMVVTNVTYNCKKQFIELCKSMNVEPMIRGLSLIGRAQHEMIDMLPNEKEEIMYEKKERKSEELERRKEKIQLFSCGAAFKQFQIDYRGYIYPCQSLMEEDLILGNVLEIRDLNEYIRERMFVNTDGYKNLEKYFPYNFKECQGCNKQIFCWNCIETIYRNRTQREECISCRRTFEKYLE